MDRQMRRWPTEQWNFEDIIAGGYYYVDKTADMWELANSKQLVFLGRPRRFGKSLLTTTFKSYFEGREDLFSGLDAARLQAESGREWATYPVLRFDMSLSNSSVDILRRAIARSLAQYEAQHGVIYSEDPLAIGDRLRYLVDTLYTQQGRQVVVLVDEYDAPLAHSLGSELAAEHAAFRELLRSFYVVLKGMLDKLRFVFLTGVSQFRQVSVFSGLNNINDITLDPDYAAICGITEEELRANFDWRVEAFAQECGVGREEMYSLLRARYDGFRFTRSAAHVYNPFSIIRSLSKLALREFWYNSGSPYVLHRVLPNYWYDFSQLHAGVTSSGAELCSFDPQGQNPVPILFQSGYLTVKSYDLLHSRYSLGFPNGEVEYAFFEGCLPRAFGDRNGYASLDYIRQLVLSLEQGDVEGFMASMEVLLTAIPYEAIYQNQPTREAQFQVAIFLLFKLAGREVHAELPSAYGRSDIELHTARIIYIFELKLQGQVRRANTTPKAALQQIKDRKYDLPYRDGGKRVVLIGMAFDGERNAFEWAYEG